MTFLAKFARTKYTRKEPSELRVNEIVHGMPKRYAIVHYREHDTVHKPLIVQHKANLILNT